MKQVQDIMLTAEGYLELEQELYYLTLEMTQKLKELIK